MAHQKRDRSGALVFHQNTDERQLDADRRLAKALQAKVDELTSMNKNLIQKVVDLQEQQKQNLETAKRESALELEKTIRKIILEENTKIQKKKKK